MLGWIVFEQVLEVRGAARREQIVSWPEDSSRNPSHLNNTSLWAPIFFPSHAKVMSIRSFSSRIRLKQEKQAINWMIRKTLPSLSSKPTPVNDSTSKLKLNHRKKARAHEKNAERRNKQFGKTKSD
jgi:hypothetical protein